MPTSKCLEVCRIRARSVPVILILRILATFTLPPDHRRIALVTPLVAGGSLAGVLDWRSRLATTPKHHHASRFGLRRRHDEEYEAPKGTLAEEEIKAIVKQVLDGLVYLHAGGFIHVRRRVFIAAIIIIPYPLGVVIVHSQTGLTSSSLRSSASLPPKGT